jgi:hypothetical protein
LFVCCFSVNSSVAIDSISVELSGYNQRSSKPIQAPKFEINLSGPYWSHYVDEQGLKLTISVTDVNRREKEKHVFKMGCREQLAAWAAELIQATTCEPGIIAYDISFLLFLI